MKIINLSQREDREAFMEERRGSITGTKAKGLYPLSRGADRTPAGLWDLIGERLTKQPEPENPMDRGTRLEQEAVRKASEKIGRVFTDDPGVWVSDTNDNLRVSPDASELGTRPTYAMEAKALGAGKHFKYLFRSLGWTGNPIELVPDEQGSYYKQQCLQYFVVNEDLQDLYFVLYNEDCAFEQHEIVIVHIQRSDIEELINVQSEVMQDMERLASEIVDKLVKYANQK